MAPLAQMQADMEATEHPYVVRTPGVCGGRAHIRGSRVSVRTIGEFFRAGEPADEIAATYPHLEPAAVYDAISYFLDHRGEIEAELEANRLESALERNAARLGADGVIRFDAP